MTPHLEKIARAIEVATIVVICAVIGCFALSGLLALLIDPAGHHAVRVWVGLLVGAVVVRAVVRAINLILAEGEGK